MPFFEASIVPLTSAIGIASPRAQGQAITITETKVKREKPSLLVDGTQGSLVEIFSRIGLKCSKLKNQKIKLSKARVMITGTN